MSGYAILQLNLGEIDSGYKAIWLQKGWETRSTLRAM